MASLLSTADLAAIQSALEDVRDTFFTIAVTINSRTTKLDQYGENPITVSVPHQFNCLSTFSVGNSGRYENVNKSEEGQRLQQGWHLLFWKADIDGIGLVVDPEADSVTIQGVEYEIKLFVPDAPMSTLGYLLYDLEIKLVSSPGQ